MAAREFRPPEERTTPLVFFLLGALTVGVTFWAIWDETYTRRPWKDRQREFNQLEYQMVAKEREALAARLAKRMAELDAKVAAAEKALEEDAEYEELQSKLSAAKVKRFELEQEVNFAKSELDEAYYEYKESVRRGKAEPALKERVDALEKRLSRLQPLFARAEKEVAAVQGAIRAKEKPRKDLLDERRRARAELDALDRRLSAIRGRMYEIEQIVIKEFARNSFGDPISQVDRCETCHLGVRRGGFEKFPQPYRTHPDRDFYLVKHNVNQIGCSSCHGGQGRALASKEKAHGWVEFWDAPMLRGAEIQANCLGCHENNLHLERAPVLARGKALERELGCFGCHDIRGTEGLRKVGPSLVRLEEKVNPAWLVRWVKRPRDYSPHTKMPFFGFTEREAADIAAFLLKAGPRQVPPRRPPRLDDPAPIAKGRALFEAVGCRGCHSLGKKAPLAPPPPTKGRPIVLRNRMFAPDLTRIGEKVKADWLYRWLKNPKAYWPETVMPSLRLSDEEALALTAFLMSTARPREEPKTLALLRDPGAIARGEELAGRFGCFGCHDIRGMEGRGKIGAELNNFGRKRVLELDFGDVVHIPETWDAWTFGKLKNPRMYATDRIELRMPNFYLSDQEAIAIRTFLKGLRREGPPEWAHQSFDERRRRVEEGRLRIEKYNCTGCHIVEDWGGGILRFYRDRAEGPPTLVGEGAKVQPEWFFGFLQRPVPLRPWLKVRMPSFQMPESDAAALVNYFAALDNRLRPYVHFDTASVPPENLPAGQVLFKQLECMKCHGGAPAGAKQEAAALAPDLNLAKWRLRPDWIVEWLKDPQKIQEGTRMPTFFLEVGTRVEVTAGKREEKKEDGRFVYAFTARREAELVEEAPVDVIIGKRKWTGRLLEIDEKTFRVALAQDLGPQVGHATLVSHGDTPMADLLGGSSLRQIEALRDYIMSTDLGKPPAPPAVSRSPSPSLAKPSSPSG
ncbi:MAG: c-type cytochrome [Nitrospinota bacterium]